MSKGKPYKKHNALLLKCPSNPNIQAMVTLRYNEQETFPIVRFQTIYYFGDEQRVKQWHTLRELYEMNFFQKRIITMFEDYFAGDLDLGKLLEMGVDLTQDDKIVI